MPVTRLARILAAAAVLGAACSNNKPPAWPTDSEPIGTGAPPATKGSDAGQTPSSAPSSLAPVKNEDCPPVDIDGLEQAARTSACEASEPTDRVNMRDKLEVKLTASTLSIAPGGRVDLLVTLTNKSKDALPLTFRLDPALRFDTEVYDNRNSRADVPKGKPPALPKGVTLPEPDVKFVKVLLPAAGSTRVRIGWDAVKTKWAPNKLKDAVGGKYPRDPDKPLAVGKYSLRVVIPLAGIAEGTDRDVTAPKLAIEVAN